MAAVSFIVLFHRAIPHLRPAVRSLLDQTWRDLEVVLVDNGTGLGLTALGEDASDPRLRLVSLPANLGFSRGFAAALDQSSGEFIGWLGYDDIALPTRVDKQVALLRADPRLGVVSSLAETIDEHGVMVGTEFALVDSTDQFAFTAYSIPSPSPSYLCRRAVFVQFPLRAEFDFAEDYDFLTRALEAWPMRGVPEVLMQYRRHGTQTTIQNRDAQVLRSCLIRLLTARRRAGRGENLAATLAETGPWLGAAPDQDVVYARFATWFLREDFTAQAVYHARKLLSVRRDPATVWFVLRIVAGALHRTPARVIFLLRLFLTGPLRAHGLRPA